MPLNISGSIVNSAIASTLNYKSVVTRGAVLNLDAGALDSYPQTGTTWFDLTTNANNGTLTNGPTFNSGDGGYITFDGTNDTVDIANASSLNISSNITIESWIYPTSTSSTQNVISKSSNSQNNGYIFPRSDNGWTTVTFYLHIGGFQTLSATYPGINRWTYTAATYDGATMIVYINGSSSNSRSQTGTITTNTNNLIIGNQPTFSEYYTGRVANARIYNRTLAASEILQNYNAQRSRFGL
jgi:hypothetical protein